MDSGRPLQQEELSSAQAEAAAARPSSAAAEGEAVEVTDMPEVGIGGGTVEEEEEEANVDDDLVDPNDVD